MWRQWLIWAAVHGFLSVACGAFGAHVLHDRKGITPRLLENFETAARYQMYHALALIAVAWLASRGGGMAIAVSGWCFALGACVFSGSLYLLVLLEKNWLGAITPIGGLALLAGWLCLGVAAISVNNESGSPQ